MLLRLYFQGRIVGSFQELQNFSSLETTRKITYRTNDETCAEKDRGDFVWNHLSILNPDRSFYKSSIRSIFEKNDTERDWPDDCCNSRLPFIYEDTPYKSALKRKSLLEANKKLAKKCISRADYLKVFGTLWSTMDRGSLLKSVVPNVVQKTHLSLLSTKNLAVATKRTIYAQFKTEDACKKKKRKKLSWNDVCKPCSKVCLKTVNFKRLVRRHTDEDRCRECCIIYDPCPPRADDNLVLKPKCLKPYKSHGCLPCTVRTFKPCQQMSMPKKRYDDFELDRPRCSLEEPCTVVRADDNIKIKKKKLKKIESTCLPCTTPDFKDGSKLKGPRRRSGWKDALKEPCIKPNVCDDVQRLDDIMCYEYVPKILPVLPPTCHVHDVCICKKEPKKKKPKSNLDCPVCTLD